jgi:hypothetical protein
MAKGGYSKTPAAGTPVVPLAAVRVTVRDAKASGDCSALLKQTFGGKAVRLKGTESYIGKITWLVVIIVILLFWPAMCVPCCFGFDKREVYIVTNSDGSEFEVDCDGNRLSEKRCCGTKM